MSLPGKPGNAGGRHELSLMPDVPMGISLKCTLYSLELALPSDSPVDISWMFKFKA